MGERKNWLGVRVDNLREQVSHLPSKAITYAQQLREDISLVHSQYRRDSYLAWGYIVGGTILTGALLFSEYPELSIAAIGVAFIGALHFSAFRERINRDR